MNIVDITLHNKSFRDIHKLEIQQETYSYSRRQYNVNVPFSYADLFTFASVCVLLYDLPLITINGTTSKQLSNACETAVNGFETVVNGHQRIVKRVQNANLARAPTIEQTAVQFLLERRLHIETYHEPGNTEYR